MPIPTCKSRYNSSYSSQLLTASYSHDLSWGTKGSDATQASDLGAGSGVGKHVEVELVTAQQDIDIAYQDALDNIRLRGSKVDSAESEPKKEQSEQAQKDTYVSAFAINLWVAANVLQANFRTNVSIAIMLVQKKRDDAKS